VNASNPSKINSVPSLAMGSTRSQNQKPDTWQSTTMLNPSEIASLRQQAKQADAEIKAYLDTLRQQAKAM
jgi:hypothetical protein